MSEAVSVSWEKDFERRRAIRPPVSKSELNRMLLLGSLYPGSVEILGENSCLDVDRMLQGLRKFDFEIQTQEGGFYIPEREGDFMLKRGPIEVESGEGGTTLRFLMALAAAREGCTSFIVPKALQRRPHSPFLETLREIGAEISVSEKGFQVTGTRDWSDVISIDVSKSSQFVSALAMVRPFLGGESRIQFLGKTVSKTYIDMTLRLMNFMGLETDSKESGLVLQGAETLDASEQLSWKAAVDASSSSIFLASGLLNWPVSVLDYPSEGQADRKFLEFASAFGGEVCQDAQSTWIEKRHEPESLREFNLRDCPDLAPVLAVLGCLIPGKTKITHAEHLRYKESNRISDLANALQGVGIQIEEKRDGLEVFGPQEFHEGLFDPKGDHRLAMSASLLGSQGEIRIASPEVVKKSYPSFWEDAHAIGWKVQGI